MSYNIWYCKVEKFLKDNWEEFAIGFILGLGFFWAIGWCAVLLGLITGVAYRAGGAGWLGTKGWRRLGVPLAIALSLQRIGWWIGGAFVLSVILLSLGYGTRSTQPPDEGSPLGNWWMDTLEQIGVSAKVAKWASRATIIGAIWIVWVISWLVK